MHVSETGLALIQDFEGFRAAPTPLPDGNWIVGYGHVRIGEAGEAVNENEAVQLLTLDLAPVARVVKALVKADLAQPQFDALVSFAFSIGLDAFAESAVLRRINAGDMVQAACAMDAWRKGEVGGELQVIDVLVRRRAAEKALFLKGEARYGAPSAFLRARLDHAASILGAPIAYTPAPAVGAVAATALKASDAQIITEVLKSEPATEALLLTQVVEEPEEADLEPVIVTAHAKPVARRLGLITPPRLPFKLPRFERPSEAFALLALMLFGVALVILGFTQLFGRTTIVSFFAAIAFAIPGFAAMLVAGFCLSRPAHKLAIAS